MAWPRRKRERPAHVHLVSFYDLFRAQQQILEGQKPGVDPALFKDRIVIVGVNADGLHEVFTTPFPEGEINGPEVHANVADALLANRSIARSPAWVTVGADARRRRHRRRCRVVPQRVAHRLPWR